MRVSTFNTFSRVLLSLRPGQQGGLRAQEQISSGLRILRPSDDPSGTARAISLRRELSQSARIHSAVGSGRARLEQAGSTLQDSSELFGRARELVLQAMSGALGDNDRASIAAELEEIRSQLLDQANLSIDDTYVFSGTALDTEPWLEVMSGGVAHVVYQGNREEQQIQIGEDALLAISAIGDRLYGGGIPGTVRFDGLSGIRSGSTADEGSGYTYLTLRHDGTSVPGLADEGLALVDGGAGDTLLGDNALSIDALAGTIQLGNGTPVGIPGPDDLGDVVVRNEQGGELHLDMRTWTGGDFSSTATGQGSISMDGATFTPLAFNQTDLELVNPELGQVLHVDTTGVLRAGKELVTFGSSVNSFDLLEGIVDDLRNQQSLSSPELLARLSNRLESLDRAHDDLLVGLGTIGARTARLTSAEERQTDLSLQLQGRLSNVEDVDLAEAALDLSRSQMILELAQAAGARLIQTSMLNFLG